MTISNSLEKISDNTPVTYGIMRDFMTSFMAPLLTEAFAKSEARMMKYTDEMFGKSTQHTDDSIESLAGMIARRFDGVDKRFVGIDKRIDGLDERVSELESRMEYRFNGIQNQLDNIYLDKVPRREYGFLCTRVKKIERKLGMA